MAGGHRDCPVLASAAQWPEILPLVSRGLFVSADLPQQTHARTHRQQYNLNIIISDSEKFLSICILCINTVPSNCTNGDIRLQNGLNAREGNVEVCVDGFWGTVCSNYWDSREATVVCKQLGFVNSGIYKTILGMDYSVDKKDLSAYSCNSAILFSFWCWKWTHFAWLPSVHWKWKQSPWM